MLDATGTTLATLIVGAINSMPPVIIVTPTDPTAVIASNTSSVNAAQLSYWTVVSKTIINYLLANTVVNVDVNTTDAVQVSPPAYTGVGTGTGTGIGTIS